MVDSGAAGILESAIGASPRRSGFVVWHPLVPLLLTVAAIGLVLGRPLVVAVGAIVLVAALAGRLLTTLSLTNVSYRCSPTAARAIEGDELELVLVIENRKPLPVPWLRIRQGIPAGLAVEGPSAVSPLFLGGTQLEVLTDLGPLQRVTQRYRLRATRRGCYTFPASTIAGGDPFGFYELVQEVAPAMAPFVVYPRTAPIPALELPRSRFIGEARTRQRWAEDPTRPAGVREYRAGDRAGAIDWKASARRGELHVRVFDPCVSQELAILLDCDTSREGPWDAAPDVLETCIVAAASVAETGLSSGYSVGMVANGIPGRGPPGVAIAPGRGPRQLPALLESLARIHPAAVRPLSSALAAAGARVLRPGVSVLCIVGVWRPQTAELLARLQARGHRVAAVYLGHGEAPRAPALNIMDWRHAPPASIDAR